MFNLIWTLHTHLLNPAPGMMYMPVMSIFGRKSRCSIYGQLGLQVKSRPAWTAQCDSAAANKLIVFQILQDLCINLEKSQGWKRDPSDGGDRFWQRSWLSKVTVNLNVSGVKSNIHNRCIHPLISSFHSLQLFYMYRFCMHIHLYTMFRPDAYRGQTIPWNVVMDDRELPHMSWEENRGLLEEQQVILTLSLQAQFF